MPVKRYNGTSWDVVSGAGLAGVPGTNGIDASPYSAGKNKIINGDMYWNQRNFTSTTTTGTYGVDRWRMDYGGGTSTYSVQTFTPGLAPVAGYEGKNYIRIVTSGQSATTDYSAFVQPIEDVRTLAGQTVTVSFWAKAASGTPKIGLTFEQAFGVGGSATVQTASSVTISTTWTRYSMTVTLPSISGKTIGTNSVLGVDLFVSLGSNYPTYGNIGIQNNTFDIWGVQVEAGTTATAFQTATGTLQGELAACQRYYEQQQILGLIGHAYSTTQYAFNFVYKVSKRTTPSVTFLSAANYNLYSGSASNKGVSSIGANINNAEQSQFLVTCSTATTAGFAAHIDGNAVNAIIINAEL